MPRASAGFSLRWEPRPSPTRYLGNGAILPHRNGNTAMLKWAVIFLVVGLVLGALGFGGIGGAFVGIAKILFFVAIAIFAVLLVLGLLAGKGVKNAID